MEAAGAPRLDVERPPFIQRGAGPPLNAGRWSAWAAAAGQERGVAPRLFTMPLRRPRDEARGDSPRGGGPTPPQLRARDAGVLSSPSDPS